MNLYKSGIIILILIMLWSVTAEAVKKEEFQPDIIRGFVEEVYNNYRSKKFENIYQVLYPGIKREVTKDEYIKFQNKNFQKYDLQISDISIDKVY